MLYGCRASNFELSATSSFKTYDGGSYILLAG